MELDEDSSKLENFCLHETSKARSIKILALIVSLGNLNTILMSVMERRREFGR